MKIKLDKGIKFRGKSLFIKIDKSEKEAYNVIQSFKCFYHRDKNMWELNKQAFYTIIDKCKHLDITIVGTLENPMDAFLNRVDTYIGNVTYQPVTKPFSYQIDSFNYSVNHNKFLLADEQGLGKTKQALDIAISRKSHMKHCLIICGVNELKWNWFNEVKLHTTETAHILGLKENGKIGSVADRLNDLQSNLDSFFLITNIETLRDENIQKQITTMSQMGVIGMTILDECHKCKNYTSQQGKAIHCCDTYYKLALTGTPIMNNAIDLYNILRWLGYENHSLTEFKNKYCIMGGFGGYQIEGYKNLDKLQAILDKCMLRRRKDDVLDLPPKIYVNEVLEMSSKQEKLYYEVQQNIRDNIDKVMLLPNPLTALIRLRQVTGNPAILTSSEIPNVKYERCKSIISEVSENGGKVIVFSNYTKIINPLVDILNEFNPALVTGETSDINTQINKFKTDNSCKVILGTIGCLGTGFTLNEANTVIFLDEPWTSANKLQAEDRCHRIGTKGCVTIITLICKDTIDERISQVVHSKQELSNRVIDNKELFRQIF